jgi:hypothetical protein
VHMVGVKDRVLDGDVLASGGRDVCFLRQARFVEPFGGLDDLVQTRGDFGRRDAPAEDVARGYGRAVKVAVGVFALDERGAFQR